MKATTSDNVQAFYEECLNYIDEIFPKGHQDLKSLLGKIYKFLSCNKTDWHTINSDDALFPEYVIEPVEYWFDACERCRLDEIEIYTDDFLTTFEKSDFFATCKNTVEGKLSWNDWSDCSVSCGGGYKLRIAHACIPSYAHCFDLPVVEDSCNTELCPVIPSTYLPVGTIISWVPKPNKNTENRVLPDSESWIPCNGVDKCKTGVFAGQTCFDLSDRVLVGAGTLGSLLDLKDASLPDHAHKHYHSGKTNYNVNYETGPTSGTGPGDPYCYHACGIGC